VSRAPKFDTTAAASYLVAVRAGVNDDIAALHAGVSLDTIRSWLRGGSPAKDKFRKDAEKARADLQLLAVGHLRRQIGEDRGAAMFIAQAVQGDLELQRLRELTTG
jgi:hypothetical protein